MPPITHSIISLLLLALLGSASLPAQTTAPDPARPTTLSALQGPATTPAELQDRHAVLLGLLKSPPATGLLVTATLPLPDAGIVPLQPGDIITSYDNVRVQTEAQLQQAIADLIAAEALNRDDPAALREKAARGELVKRVELVVRRDGANVKIIVASGGLGVTLRAVEVAVPAPANPAPTPRESLPLDWSQLPLAHDSLDTWLRCYDDRILDAIEHHHLERAGESWTLTIRHWPIENHATAAPQTCTLTFTPGDHAATAAFALDSLRWAAFDRTTRAQRKGAIVQGTLSVPRLPRLDIALPTITEAIPAPALQTLAATLPHQPDQVLPLAVISEIDLQTRLGYALQTLGKVKVKRVAGDETDAWAVRLWHYGRVEQTLWFDDASRLLGGRAGEHATWESVPDERSARHGLDPPKN